MQNGKTTSANQPITFNIESLVNVTKAELKDYVDKRIYILNPELRSKFTKRLLDHTIIYLEGYSNRLKEDISPPINLHEFKTTLLSEGFRYIYKKIDK